MGERYGPCKSCKGKGTIKEETCGACELNPGFDFNPDTKLAKEREDDNYREELRAVEEDRIWR